MTRYIRNQVLQLAIETTYGALPAFVTADNLLMTDVKFRIDPDVHPRNLIRGHMGGSEHLAGTRRTEIEFDLELAGSGLIDTPPQWGKALRASGMAQAISAGSRSEYTPTSTAFESASLRFFADGVRYTSRGARGNVMIKIPAYEPPKLSFKFMGFDTEAIVQAVPNTDFTAWKAPLVISDANAGDIRLGGTYAAGVVSGGVVLPSRGVNFDLGQKLSHIKLLGGESIDITDRDTSGDMMVALTAADEISWRDAVNANTMASVGFNFGLTAGNRVALFAPNAQRVNPQISDYEGRMMMQSNLRVLPLVSNDELRIVSR